MGCTASAPTALEPRPAAAAAATAGAAETKLLRRDEHGGEARMSETEESESSMETAERVLPASDSVETSLDVDSRIESATTATANDIHIIDLESESSPCDDIVELGHLKQVRPTDKLLPEENGLPPPLSPRPQPPLCPTPLGEVGTSTVSSPETEAAKAELPLLDTGQDTDTGENDLSDEEWSPLPGSALERRPTRWEALTDVAAELPPKLTVDPLTGQIYALKRD